MRLAIYDLDRTITARPTFTPFLAYAAWHVAPWRVMLMPVWIAAMVGYRAGLYSRTALKRFGMGLFLPDVPVARLETIGARFAQARMVSPGLHATVQDLLDEDRAAQAELMIATAAFGFYASAFASSLGIRHLIATQWDGRELAGGNCYGETKLQRVKDWLEQRGISRDDITIRFVSDSFADAPLLDWADEAIFVTTHPRSVARATARGWRVLDPTG